MPKLSPLSLPSLTTLLFALIALVIWGTGLAGLLPGALLWWPLILLPLLLLPLRDFLHWPEREKQQGDLRPPQPHEAPLQTAVDTLSRRLGLLPPQVLIGDEQETLRTFGSFRRAFILVPSSSASILAADLISEEPDAAQPAMALLAHELAHFANRDMQRAAFAHSLLKMTGLFALASLWISIALVAVLVDIGPEIVQREFWRALSGLVPLPGFDLTWMWEWMHARDPAAMQRLGDPTAAESWAFHIFYLANIFLPLLLAVPFLSLFLWRKLLRVREFYADARAAELMDSAEAVHQAMVLHQVLSGVQAPSAGACAILTRPRALLRHVVAKFPPLSYHPSRAERKQALRQPATIYGRSWHIALWTGLTLLLLELILRSSLTLPYLSQPGAHLPLLTASLVFSVWLLPRVCSGWPLPRLLRTILALSLVFILVKLSLNILDGLFVLAAMSLGHLDTVGAILDAYLRSMLGPYGAGIEPIVGPGFDWPQIIDWHILRPILYYLLFALPALIATLLIDAWLKQRVLLWYAWGERIRRVFGAITLALVSVQWLAWVPLGNRLFFPFFYEGMGWPTLLGMGLGGGLLLATGLFLYRQHSRHARRCPACHEIAPGPFQLGACCPQCQAPFHPWLLARY